MKKTLLLNLCMLTLLMGLKPINAQLLIYDGFDYAIPGYIGGNGAAGSSSNNWTTHSVTTGQTTTIDLLPGSLNYLGIINPVGNRILLPGTNSTVSRDVNRAFTTTSTTVYYSAIINVLDNTQISSTNTDYFMCIGATAGSNVTILGARLGIKSVNSGSNYRLSICNTSGTGTSYTDFAQDLNFGTTYLVVVKYDRLASPTSATLWVNPTLTGGTEPGGSVTNASSGSTFSAFASICLRNGTYTPKVEIDEIRVGESFADVTPIDQIGPKALFVPELNATGVLANTTPLFLFDEPVRKVDGTELLNSDLNSLITFKKTDAGGSNVPFTATIDAGKKIITVSPTSLLENSQLYYLSIGPVEDNLGFESLEQATAFTTISAASPTITVTYPAGGEVMYSGDIKVITWTTTNFDVAETVKIEVYVPTEAGPYTWIELAASTPNDGEYQVTVGPDADYGTGYVIRITGVTNGAADSSEPFTVIATATNLADLRQYINGTVIRYDGEAIITFIRTDNRNQKYIQDDVGGILIDDGAGILTTVLSEGDKIKYLEGTIGNYNGVIQIVPTKASVTVVSSGNSVTPIPLTLIDFRNNYDTYESRLVRISNVTFQGADGSATFAASSNYTLSDGTNTLTFRTFKATESNIVGTVIPTQPLNLTGIGAEFNSTPQISSRTTADFSVVTAIDRNTENNLVVYPVPAVNELNIRNLPDVTAIEILDVTGKVVLRYEDGFDSEIKIMVAGLRKGIYFLKITTPSGKIVRRFIKS